MNALNLLFEEYFEKYFKPAKFKIQIHAKMYLKYTSIYKYNKVFKIHCKILHMYLKYMYFKILPITEYCYGAILLQLRVGTVLEGLTWY